MGGAGGENWSLGFLELSYRLSGIKTKGVWLVGRRQEWEARPEALVGRSTMRRISAETGRDRAPVIAHLQKSEISCSFIFNLDLLGNDLAMGQKHFLCSFYEPRPVGRITVGKTSGSAQILPLGAGRLQPIDILVLKGHFWGGVW